MTVYHEHVYWDQASVLVQTGLLDPKLVPEKMQSRGMKRLPVVGKDAARRILGRDLNDEEEGEADNELIPGWGGGDSTKDNGGRDTKKEETKDGGQGDQVGQDDEDNSNENAAEATEQPTENEGEN